MTKKLILNSGGMGAKREGLVAIADHFAGCKKVAYIAYAQADLDAAVANLQSVLPAVPFVGVHAATDPRDVLRQCDGIWVTGGNSFRLVHNLHRYGLITPVKQMVAAGIPYAGASAGANVAGPTICTTNDMPIIRRPASLDSFDLVPFQINPHFLDASRMPADFRGETREQRLAEFLEENDVPVVGLREGTWLVVSGDVMTLVGAPGAVVFERGVAPVEIKPGADLSRLLRITPHFDSPVLGN